MNFMLRGNALYRLFFYIFYQILSKSPIRNIKIIRNFLKMEMKRIYRGRINGMKLFFRFEDIGVLRDIFIDKIYYVRELEVCKSIVDAGAHIGAFSLFILSINPNIKKIICIEPEEDNFKILTKNLKDIDNIQVELLRIALSNKRYLGKLYLKESSVAHTLEEKLKDSNTTKYEIVIVDKLDNIINGNVDVVKIDVEGYENKVIDGMKSIIKLYKPKLIIEAGHFKNEKQIIIKKLKKIGYNCKVLKRKEPIIYAFNTQFY